MLVEKGNSLCFKEALVILLFASLGVHLIEKGVTLLVELHCFLGVSYLVIELEYVILEIFEDINVRLKIDRSLQRA